MITEDQYKAALRSAIEGEKEQISRRLHGVSRNLPKTAEGFDIGIHPDQDQEGFLSVWVHAQGPDAFVLNKAISDHRLLFEIKLEQDGKLSGGLPMFEPFGEEFPVGDIQVDAVANWFEEMWTELVPSGLEKPITVFGSEFGTIVPIKLN